MEHVTLSVSELSGAALDWAVAKCEGYTDLHRIAGRMAHEPQLGVYPPRREYGVMDLFELGFSTDWAQGGPIIERECINLFRLDPKTEEDNRFWLAHIDGIWCRYGVSALQAAMRCYVVSKLGDKIDVPLPLVG